VPAADFLDSDILLYDLWLGDTRKQSIAGDLVRCALADNSGVISFQVIQECLSVISRQGQPAWDTDQTRDYLESVLEPLCRVYASMPLYRDAISLQSRWGFFFAIP
jgi:predicted nucleic acid-binding protein